MSKHLKEIFEYMHDIFKGNNKDAISECYDKQEEISQLRMKDIIKKFPMKPIAKKKNTTEPTNIKWYLCPECYGKVGRSIFGIKMNYCPQCGQKLDWSKE